MSTGLQIETTMMPAARVRVPLLTLAWSAILALGALGPASAWSPEAQRAIAAEAARLAPPDLAGQLARHTKQLERGAVEPFGDTDPLRHTKNEDGSGALDRALAEETKAAVAALRGFRPFAELVYRLGRVAHFAADLNNPLNASTGDPDEGRYFRDFFLYADSARPRFAVVLYENSAVVTESGGVDRLAARALERGRALYPLVGREYRRISFGNGIDLFDDRSTAYGVAALAYSHAVSDAARLYRYIWLAGGGSDPRPVLDRQRDRLVLLPRGGQ